MPYCELKPEPVMTASLPDEPSVAMGLGEKAKLEFASSPPTSVIKQMNSSTAPGVTVLVPVTPEQGGGPPEIHLTFQVAGALFPFKAASPVMSVVTVKGLGSPVAPD